MGETLGIALVGCGTVGGGVAEILLTTGTGCAQRGPPLSLRRVVVRDPAKPRPVDLSRASSRPITRPRSHDPAVHVVVELIGGTTAAKKVVLDALAAGKHVVTANKALLAEPAREVFEAARKAERAVCFEAAVAGGVPIIRRSARASPPTRSPRSRAFSTARRTSSSPAMAERGLSYAAALAEAQRLGYAEADPTLDVDGSDAAHKLAVLAQIAFGVAAKPHEIERQGIDTLDAMDIRFADELGYTIKLLAEAWADRPTGRACTLPRCCCGTPTCSPRCAGRTTRSRSTATSSARRSTRGRGPGMMPTASSVRRRPDRPGGRPGAADVRRGETLVRDEQGLHGRAAGTRPQPLLPAAAGGGQARRAGRRDAHPGGREHQHFAASFSTKPRRTAAAQCRSSS